MKLEIDAAWAKISHTDSLVEVIVNNGQTIPGLVEYKEILVRRSKWLGIMCLTIEHADGGLAQFQVDALPDWGPEVAMYETARSAVSSLHSAWKDADATEDVKKKAKEELCSKLAAINDKTTELSMVLRMFIWDAKQSKFTDLPLTTSLNLIDKFVRLFAMLSVACKSELFFKKLFTECIENRVPLPIANLKCEDLCSTVGFSFQTEISKQLVTEEEVTTSKKMFERQHKVATEIVSKCSAAATDIETFIEKKTSAKGERQRREREEQDQ